MSFFCRGLVVKNVVAGEKGFRLVTIGEALRATHWYFFKEYHNVGACLWGL